jgi:acetylornithine/N-succinyldiaminopimelate aminotransferase
MTGIDIEKDAWPVLEACLAAGSPGPSGTPRGTPAAALPSDASSPAGSFGILILSAGQKTLRLLPPYVISDGEIEQGLALLKTVLETAS